MCTMPSDAVTFFLSFAAVFLGLAAYVWHLERMTHRLAQRVEALESLESLTAKPKPDDATREPRA